jgi:hypothetical protein
MSAPSVTKATECEACGHDYDLHCESGMPHFDSEDHRYSCIFRHCQCGPCQCWAFVNPYTGAITPWRRPVEETTPCARCSHGKQHHCSKGKTSIVVDGKPYGCRHYMAWMASPSRAAPSCDSTACAMLLDAEQKNFCPCPRFQNPYAKQRKKKSSMPLFEPEELAQMHADYLRTQPPPTKTHAEILIEVCREDPTLTVAELVEASGHSATWVRRTLKKAGIVLVKAPRQSRRSASATGEEVRP